MSLCNGKYILYCPAFGITWSVSPWIGEGEYWAKMCPEKDEYHPGWSTYLWFMDLFDLSFPKNPGHGWILDVRHRELWDGVLDNLDYYGAKRDKRLGITRGLKDAYHG